MIHLCAASRKTRLAPISPSIGSTYTKCMPVPVEDYLLVFALCDGIFRLWTIDGVGSGCLVFNSILSRRRRKWPRTGQERMVHFEQTIEDLQHLGSLA